MNLTETQIRKIQEEILRADMPDKECIRRALVEIAVYEEDFKIPKVSELLANPPEFDGKNCLFCRGMRRLIDCQQCHGSQPTSDGARQLWEKQERQRWGREERKEKISMLNSPKNERKKHASRS